VLPPEQRQDGVRLLVGGPGRRRGCEQWRNIRNQSTHHHVVGKHLVDGLRELAAIFLAVPPRAQDALLLGQELPRNATAMT
jgi:hypothetical protein